MSLFRHVQTLLLMQEQSNHGQTGQSFVVLPVEQAGDGENQLSFQVFVEVGQSGGGGSPSLTVLLETSPDGTSWVPVLTLLVGDTASAKYFEPVAALGPQVRARTVLTGNPLPSHVAVVRLASDHAFRLLPAVLATTPGSSPSSVANAGG